MQIPNTLRSSIISLERYFRTSGLSFVKVHTDDNLADVLTKGLPSERFARLREKMGIG